MSVLITGASGSICQSLSTELKELGLNVNLLTANLNKKSKQNNIYFWNPPENYIDLEAFEGVETIIHLAGAGIADKGWTRDRKEILLSSRVKTAELLATSIKTLNKPIKKYISAGAIGIYEEGIKGASEDGLKGNDFMANLCKDWESSAKLFQEMGIPTAIFRTGIVLDKNSGFYQKIAQLAKYYFAAIPGSGKQWVSWIHMEDMVKMYLEAVLKTEVSGIYNATAPEPVLLSEMIKGIARNENRSVVLPNIPPFVLKLIFGEMSQVILSSKHVLPEKWLKEGRSFMYNSLNSALKAIQ
jgi:hypothetical protein